MMNDTTKQHLIVTMGIVIFFALLFGALTVSSFSPSMTRAELSAVEMCSGHGKMPMFRSDWKHRSLICVDKVNDQAAWDDLIKQVKELSK